MKVLFICRDVYYFDYPLIAKVLSNYNDVETYALTFSTKTHSIILNNHPNSFRDIYNLDDFFYLNNDFEKVPMSEKIQYLSEMENELKISSLSSLLYVDRTIIKNDYEDMITIAYGISHFIKNLLSNEFNLIIGEIGTFLEYLLLHYSVMKRILFLSLSSSRFKGRIAFFSGANGEALGLRRNFKYYKETDLTKEEEDLFDEFYEDFLKGRKRPEYSDKAAFFKKVKNIVHVYRQRAHFKNKSRYILESIDRSSLNHLVNLRLKKFYHKNMAGMKGLFKPLDSEKFIFFPLHVQPEISTLLYAPYYVDQPALIEIIAKCLPVTHILAVKEHPAMFGLRDISFYRRISKLPNVRLIHPFEDSYEIIKKSEGTIVLTGTVGLESILLGKPVIILGNVFYDIYDLAFKVDSIKELPIVLSEKIKNYRNNPDRLKRFVLAYMRSTYPGIIDNPIEKKEMLADENIRNIASAIIQASSDAAG